MVDRGNGVGGGGGPHHGSYRHCNRQRHRRRWSSDKSFRVCWIISSSSHTSDNCVDKKMLILVIILVRLALLDERLLVRYNSIRREILPVY